MFQTSALSSPVAPSFRDLWRRRVDQEHAADNLTRAFRDVLFELAEFRGTDGYCVPAQTTLAKAARCSVKTVQRALEMAVMLNLITIRPRYKDRGWRRVRTSNQYILNVPDAPVETGRRPRKSIKRQKAPGQSQEEKEARKRAIQGMARDAAGAGDLLARRREQFLANQRALICRATRPPLPKTVQSTNCGHGAGAVA